MQIEIVPGDQLTSEQTADWSRLQQADPSLSSPFFRPEFTQTVAAYRDDVEVAVLKEDDETVGFFPYQRERRSVAYPVGDPFADYQGPVLKSAAAVDPTELLRKCGLSVWHFDHLLASTGMFHAYHRLAAESPYMDLSDGFEAYRTERRKAGSRAVKQTMQKSRKIEREVGPLEFVPHTDDLHVLDVLLRWKRAQCVRRRSGFCIQREWSVPFLESLLKLRTPALSGMLSVLNVGDRIGAIVLGIRSYGMVHLLVPAYDPVFANYSPGLILLVKLAEAASSLGITRIDIGKGTERYKGSLATGATPIAEGCVDLRPGVHSLRYQWNRAREVVRASSICAPAQTFLRRMRYLRSAVTGRCRECSNPSHECRNDTSACA